MSGTVREERILSHLIIQQSLPTKDSSQVSLINCEKFHDVAETDCAKVCRDQITGEKIS